MDRKKKLETSLEGLFSGKKKDIQGEANNAPAPQPPAPAGSGVVIENAGSAPTGKDRASAAKKTAVRAAKPEEPEKPAEVPATASVSEKASPQASEVNVVKEAQGGKQVEPPRQEAEQKESKPASGESRAIVPAEQVSIQVVDEQEEDIQVLVFGLAGVYYGVEVSYVQTIIKPQPVYLIPGTVEYIRGLINLRGAVVPVVDLRSRFMLASKDIDKDTRFVVVELGDVMASMVVDMVQGVETIPHHLIEEPSGVVMNIDTTYLRAVARMEKQLILILNLHDTLRRS